MLASLHNRDVLTVLMKSVGIDARGYYIRRPPLLIVVD